MGQVFLFPIYVFITGFSGVQLQLTRSMKHKKRVHCGENLYTAEKFFSTAERKQRKQRKLRKLKPGCSLRGMTISLTENGYLLVTYLGIKAIKAAPPINTCQIHPLKSTGLPWVPCQLEPAICFCHREVLTI